jgi:uncharacterized membrane protein YsdA (DUF1294 family)/cold shock CspA family protein
MRLVGRISDWNDDKGYGFVVPHDGGVRASVHVKAFQSGPRRPLAGDLISYEVASDAKGRTNAARVRFAGQRIEQPRPPRRSAAIPRRALSLLFLLAVVGVAVAGLVPLVLPIAYVVLSGLSWLMYWWDKDAAGQAARRTPESTLHLVDLLGGWPGALIAQQQFRHKTVKASFQAVFWLTVLTNLVAAVWLVRSGAVQALAEALG